MVVSYEYFTLDFTVGPSRTMTHSKSGWTCLVIHSKTDIYCLNTCIKVVDRLQLMTTHTKQSLHPAHIFSTHSALCTCSP